MRYAGDAPSVVINSGAGVVTGPGSFPEQYYRANRNHPYLMSAVRNNDPVASDGGNRWEIVQIPPGYCVVEHCGYEWLATTTEAHEIQQGPMAASILFDWRDFA